MLICDINGNNINLKNCRIVFRLVIRDQPQINEKSLHSFLDLRFILTY